MREPVPEEDDVVLAIWCQSKMSAMTNVTFAGLAVRRLRSSIRGDASSAVTDLAWSASARVKIPVPQASSRTSPVGPISATSCRATSSLSNPPGPALRSGTLASP
jgi:hypothetical protein